MKALVWLLLSVPFISTCAIERPIPPAAQVLYQPRIPAGLTHPLPVPPANPMTSEKIALGRQLFFETMLSKDNSLSCSSCHNPDNGYSDDRRFSLGIGRIQGKRNAPSLLNVAYRSPLFWDGRASSLEEQVLEVVSSPEELGGIPEEAVDRLRSSRYYRTLFLKAFGSEKITLERVAFAIASFERTLLSGDSSFDLSQKADRPRPLMEAARRGLALFRGKANCHICHREPLFTDNRFHNTGVSWDANPRDLGLAEVTGREDDRGKFRTPPLRDLLHSAPYMHDGSMASLEEVIDFYSRGGNPNPNVDPAIQPIRLTPSEKADLALFLRSLNGTSWQEAKWPRQLIR